MHTSCIVFETFQDKLWREQCFVYSAFATLNTRHEKLVGQSKAGRILFAYFRLITFKVGVKGCAPKLTYK